MAPKANVKPTLALYLEDAVDVLQPSSLEGWVGAGVKPGPEYEPAKRVFDEIAAICHDINNPTGLGTAADFSKWLDRARRAQVSFSRGSSSLGCSLNLLIRKRTTLW